MQYFRQICGCPSFYHNLSAFTTRTFIINVIVIVLSIFWISLAFSIRLWQNTVTEISVIFLTKGSYREEI